MTNEALRQRAQDLNVPFLATMWRGILACALGIALILQPDKVLPMLANFMGVYWLLSGVTSLRWGAGGKRPQRLAQAAGIVGILAGLTTIASSILPTILNDLIIFLLLGSVILLTGVLHMVGGFRYGEDATRQWSWSSFLLGLFEFILGGLLIVSPLDIHPYLYWAATVWAMIGGFMLIGDAMRLRARSRKDWRADADTERGKIG